MDHQPITNVHYGDLLKGLMTVTLAALAAVLVVQFIFPYIRERPRDLEIVQIDEKIAPFFDTVLSSEDLASRHGKLHDPVTIIRGKQLLPEVIGRFNRFGPHDVLGFRNTSVPNIADVVTIGDSHTYSYNVPHADSWPVLLEQELQKGPVYNMSLGGWGPLQYLAAFKKAIAFQPQVVIIGIYSGNDAIDAFRFAYASDYWKDYRVDPDIKLEDVPPIQFPPPENEWWTLRAKDGFEMAFTPRYRHLTNLRDDHSVRVGYAITQKVAEEILSLSAKYGVRTYITALPSKELAYARRVRASEPASGTAPMPDTYDRLVEDETQNVRELQALVESHTPGAYLDLLNPLQEAALTHDGLYSRDRDGHPTAAGHRVIATHVSSAISSQLATLADGIYRSRPRSGREALYEVEGGTCRYLESEEDLVSHGHSPEEVQDIPFRMIQSCRRTVADHPADLRYVSTEAIDAIPQLEIPE